MDKQALQKIIGENLYRIRTERKLTREAISEAADLSTTFYANLESGKKMMSVVTLRKLADALGVPVDSLLYADRPPAAVDRMKAFLRGKPEDMVCFSEKLIRFCFEELPVPNRENKGETENDAGAK